MTTEERLNAMTDEELRETLRFVIEKVTDLDTRVAVMMKVLDEFKRRDMAVE